MNNSAENILQNLAKKTKIDQNALIKQFMNITGVDDFQLASSCLKASDWNIDQAMSIFYDKSDEAVKVEHQSK